MTKEQAREALLAQAQFAAAIQEDEEMRAEGPTPIHTLRRFHDLGPQEEIPGIRAEPASPAS